MLTSYLGSAQFGSQPGHYHNWDFCDLIQFLQVNTRMMSRITPWPLSSALFPLCYLHIVSVFDSLQSEPLTELQNKPWTNQNHHNTTNKQHCIYDTIDKQKALLSWHHGQTESTAVMSSWANRKHCCHDTMGKQKALLSCHHGQTENADVMTPWANRNADVMTPRAYRNYCSYDTTGKQKAQLSWHLSPLMSHFIFRNHLPPSDTIILHICSWGSILIYTKKQIQLDSQIYSRGFFSKSFFILIVFIILKCKTLMLDHWLTEIKLHTNIHTLCRLKYTHAPVEVYGTLFWYSAHLPKNGPFWVWYTNSSCSPKHSDVILYETSKNKYLIYT